MGLLNNVLLNSLISVLFFAVVNFVSFKILVKKKTLLKILFVVFLTLSEVGILAYAKTFLVYQNTMILCGILSVMTICDIENMEVPEWTLIALPLCSILNYLLLCNKLSNFLYGNIITAIVSFLLLTLIGKLYNNMLGGADIIMIASISLIFGLMHMLYMLIIGCVVSILFMLIYSKIKKSKATGVPLPFLPGLTIGFLFAFLFI